MARSRMSPLAAVARGALAGVVGTAAMDLLWFLRYKRGGGESGFMDWEFSVGLNEWSKAPAPARLGKQLYEGFFQRELPAERAALTNNVMHWGYGVGWGALYGLLAGSARRPQIRSGLLFGSLVWAVDYVVLPLAKLYRPIWEYDLATLWQDLSAHLVYGVTTAAVFRAQKPRHHFPC
jgi:hypothetical protein